MEGRKVSFPSVGSQGRRTVGILRASQELAELFKVRRLVLATQRGEVVTQEDIEFIHSYVSYGTLLPGLPFWQILSAADQLNACKQLRFCKVGIRGMDSILSMTAFQSSINIMLKGQAFICKEGTKEETCITESGIWGNIILPSRLTLLSEKAGGILFYEEDDKLPKQFIMQEGCKYRVFFNPKSEYLMLTNVDLNNGLNNVKDAIERLEILEEVGLGFLRNNNNAPLQRMRRRKASMGGSAHNAGTSTTTTSPSLLRHANEGTLEGLIDASTRPSSRGDSICIEKDTSNAMGKTGQKDIPPGSRLIKLSRGSILIYQGDAVVEELYIVTKGTCRCVVVLDDSMQSSSDSRTPVFIDGFQTKVDLRTAFVLNQKALIGDIPIFLGFPQPAFVIAENDMEALVFHKDEVKQGLDTKAPNVRKGFEKAARQKLQEIEKRIEMLKEGLYINKEDEIDQDSTLGRDDLYERIARCKRSKDLVDMLSV